MRLLRIFRPSAASRTRTRQHRRCAPLTHDDLLAQQQQVAAAYLGGHAMPHVLMTRRSSQRTSSHATTHIVP